jgi:hypothetical protein
MAPKKNASAPASSSPDNAIDTRSKLVTLENDAKCNPEELKVGDVMSRINYITVVSVDESSCTVRDTTGFEWEVGKTILENQAYTSNQYTKVMKVTRTELARLLEQDIRDSVFSCCFNKMPNLDEQDAMLERADLSSGAKRKRVAKDLQVGSERIMHAYAEDTHELGRLPVFDIEAQGHRLVDLRTLKWLTFRNTRYELK